MASMLLVGSLVPKPASVRMPNPRPYYPRKTVIISARRGRDVSKGGGGQINQTRRSVGTADIAGEKAALGGSNTEKENKKKSKENVDNGTTTNTEASG